jgi:non-specific serine/threonine protein kinase
VEWSSDGSLDVTNAPAGSEGDPSEARTFVRLPAKGTIFISRAGSDHELATRVGRILEEDGYTVVLQQWDFRVGNFVAKMHEALRDATRVVALLSPAYMASDHCSAEWQNAIADDPLNERGRLVVLRIADCKPVGLLAGIVYWDLYPVLGEPAAFEELLLRAVGADEGGREDEESSEPPAPMTAPAMPPDAPPKGNLRLQLGRLVGRDALVRELCESSGAHRLVTLVGPGGVGKTSLALEAAHRMQEGMTDGAWFVDFLPVSDARRVASTVSSTLGLRERSGEDPLETAARHLAARRALIVLDNCEHVIGEATRVAETLAASCPDVRLIATSRAALGIPAEKVLKIPPLDLAPLGARLTADQARAYGAIDWFVERATLVDSRFKLSDENAPLVAEICRRVDGIPFMIELIAARVTVLSIAELAERIARRFPLTEGSHRDGVAGRKTPKDLIDWSFGLLNRQEQCLFGRLSIFAGGCTLEAAEAVCAGDPIDPLDVLDIISSLVDKSLLVAEMPPTGTRYRYLEATRAYASSLLAASDERDAVTERHATWVATFADRVNSLSWSTSEVVLVPKAWPDIENVRSGLQWSLDVKPNIDVAGRIAGGLVTVWQARCLGEGLRAIERVFAQFQPPYPSKIEALLSLALASTSVAKRKVETAARASALYEAAGDLMGLADSLRLEAEGLRQMQQLTEAEAAALRSLTLFQEIGKMNSPKRAGLLQTYASILVDQGRYEEAREAFEEATERFEALGDIAAAARTKLLIAELDFSVGNSARALETALQAAATFERIGDWSAQACVMANAAAYLLAQGEAAAARANALRALQLSIAVDNALYATLALQHLGTVLAIDGDVRAAARILDYVDDWLASQGFEREATEQSSYDAGLRAIRAAIGEDARLNLLKNGPKATREELIAHVTAETKGTG